MEKTNYEVVVNSTLGACDTELFRKMAMKGDITSVKIEECINKVVSIIGIAECHVTTKDKDFSVNYFATNELGFIATGSNIFLQSVLDYMDEVDYVKIQKVKTKKGITYKAVPILMSKAEDEVL